MFYTLRKFENWIEVHTFGIIFIFVFFLFLWMLKRLSKKYKYDFDLFKNNILVLFVSSFLFSRLFYIFFHWKDFWWLSSLKLTNFFINTDYKFSLYWLIFWFFLALLVILKVRKESILKYIDWVVLSFLFVLWIWYIWGLTISYIIISRWISFSTYCTIYLINITIFFFF